MNLTIRKAKECLDYEQLRFVSEILHAIEKGRGRNERRMGCLALFDHFSFALHLYHRVAHMEKNETARRLHDSLTAMETLPDLFLPIQILYW